jgi:hypothetical protein
MFFGYYGDSLDASEGNFPENVDTQNDSSIAGNGEGGRWLRRSPHNNLDVGRIASVSSSSSAALPWTRQIQEQQQQQPSDGGVFDGLEPSYKMTVLPASQRNYRYSQSPSPVPEQNL